MAVKRSSVLWAVLLAFIVILAAAWIDGGEQPLRPISQPVEIPEGV